MPGSHCHYSRLLVKVQFSKDLSIVSFYFLLLLVFFSFLRRVGILFLGSDPRRQDGRWGTVHVS